MDSVVLHSFIDESFVVVGDMKDEEGPVLFDWVCGPKPVRGSSYDQLP